MLFYTFHCNQFNCAYYFHHSSNNHDDVIKWKHFRLNGALCGEFTSYRWNPSLRSVTWSFDVFFDLRMNKRVSIKSRRRWFETPWWSLWRHCDVCWRCAEMLYQAKRYFLVVCWGVGVGDYIYTHGFFTLIPIDSPKQTKCIDIENEIHHLNNVKRSWCHSTRQSKKNISGIRYLWS